MKTIVLAILYVAATTEAFVPSKGVFVLEDRCSFDSFYKGRTSTTIHGKISEGHDMTSMNAKLTNNDMEAIYEIENVNENKAIELRKAGIHFTNALRNLQLDYEEELADLNNQIKLLKKQQKDLNLKAIHAEFAYEMFRHYTRTGSLTFKFRDDDKACETSNELHNLYQQSKKDAFSSKAFDEELFKLSIAKYGFEHIEHSFYYRGDLAIKLGLLSESSPTSD